MRLALAAVLVLGAASVPPIGLGQTTKALTVKQQSGSGGTMHYSTRVELSIDGGTRAVLPGRQAPIVDHVVALDGAWLLLGWASGGSGFQSHELQVVSGALAPVAKLTWFTYRAERGVLLRRDADGWSVGIPDGTSEESSLRIDEKKVKPSFTDFALTESTWSYCPPFDEALKPPKRAAWFRVSASGFRAE